MKVGRVEMQAIGLARGREGVVYQIWSLFGLNSDNFREIVEVFLIDGG